MDEVKIIVESSDAFFQAALKMARKLDRGDYSPNLLQFLSPAWNNSCG
jgi:hypothetical protein